MPTDGQLFLTEEQGMIRDMERDLRDASWLPTQPNGIAAAAFLKICTSEWARSA